MAVEIIQLGIGEISGTTSKKLYEVPAGKAAVVRNMRFVNTHTGAVTITVTLTNGSEVRKVLPSAMTIPEGYSFMDETEMTLEAGDKLDAVLGAAGEIVDYVVSGLEREVV